MSRPRIRKRLPGPEYRYDNWGRVVKRKRLPYGPKHSQFDGHGGDFSGNRGEFIYFDIPAEGSTTNCITTRHVEKLKALADASGNPKIWRADECSQEFLKSLIPGR